MKLLLIDIDGALVDCDRLDTECYSRAIEDVVGVKVDTDWSQYRNVTESGVLDEIIAKHEVQGSRSQIHRKVELRYLERMREFLAENPAELSLIQGAKEFIEQMKARNDTHLAIATGGWESVAKLKLRTLGIELSGITFASSSDAMSRTEIMALAAFRAKQDSGNTFVRRVFFGHGDWNKFASSELGYDFVAVGDDCQHHTHIQNFVHYHSAFSQLAIH